MSEVLEHCTEVLHTLPEGVTLVAVSKTHPSAMIEEAYTLGLRDFGENKVQELVSKARELPADIRWHMIGHLQTNKVRQIAPFVHMIHSVDSLHLLECIDKEGRRAGRRLRCLLQVHVAQESEKFGLYPSELRELLPTLDVPSLTGLELRGLMAVATNTNDGAQVEGEFATAQTLFEEVRQSGRAGLEHFDTLCMGMSHDYTLALRHGATMVRIGTTIFGQRDYGRTN